jgi:hypothetical protein
MTRDTAEAGRYTTTVFSSFVNIRSWLEARLDYLQI